MEVTLNLGNLFLHVIPTSTIVTVLIWVALEILVFLWNVIFRKNARVTKKFMLIIWVLIVTFYAVASSM